jgi:hypothetical protein
LGQLLSLRPVALARALATVAAHHGAALDDPPPGEEAEIDYFYVGHWVDPEAEHRHRLSAFLMTLSHSRHQFLYPVLSEDATSWLEAHVAAFSFFRGAPRRLGPDNLGSAILKGDRYDPRVNRAYAELVRYYGCIVDPSRLATPTDKPREERAGGYSRASACKNLSNLAGAARIFGVARANFQYVAPTTMPTGVRNLWRYKRPAWALAGPTGPGGALAACVALTLAMVFLTVLGSSASSWSSCACD